MVVMDVFDSRILKSIAGNSKKGLKEIGREVGLFSASSVSKRISNMEKEGLIKGYKGDVNYEKLGYDFLTVTFVKANYKYNYNKEIGKSLSKIKGVVGVYFLLGEIDFVLLTLSRSKEEYAKILDQVSSIEGVERSDSRTILEVYKDYDVSGLEF